jgi:gliding-associated putative ABC transporter substrate-binding component GldG
MRKLNTLLILIGIVLVINLLSKQFFLRWDVTQEKQYTLSKATKDILKNLDEPVTITAYFTSDLPQQYAKSGDDFKDLLVEYNSRSKGMVNYEFVNPNEDPETEQEAISNGISPLLINVREKDEAVQKKAFMGAHLQAGEQQDIIPFIQPGGPIEYMLTTAIKKISVVDKPAIGLLQGHGEAGLQELQLVQKELGILYNIEPVDLNTNPEIPPRFKTLLIVKPEDTIPPAHIQRIDNYLNNGGNLTIALNSVKGDFQTAQGSVQNTGLEDYLRTKGIDIQNQFVIDASSGQISVQQRQGFFTFNSNVNFPFFPKVSSWPEHPITKGIEQVVFPFASPVNAIENDEYVIQTLVSSSEKSGTINPPTYFDVQRKWRNADFPMGSTALGVIATPTDETKFGSRIILFSDGDFPMGGQSRGGTPDNVSLLVNSVDFLSDDTGLIELRTKGVTTRPIKELEDAEKNRIKWTNFLLPVALVLLYGFFRSQRNKRKRMRRMETRYE